MNFWSSLLILSVAQIVASDLEMVILVFRHGDRTPILSYPNDPYKDYDYDGLGLGALTPVRNTFI